MSYSYSPSTRGFYRSDIHGDAIPADALAISDAQYATLLAGVNSGEIIAMVDGAPVLQAPPAVAPSIPRSVTDKQFFQAAGQLGIITKPEAIAFMSNGAMPTSLATALATLPADEQYAATMAVLGARNFLRTDPFVVALSQAMGKTPAQVDALFTLAATL